MDKTKFFANLGRVLLVFGALSLFGAWIAIRQGTFLSFSEVHWFSDAAVWSLLGIGFLVDALLHSKNI